MTITASDFEFIATFVRERAAIVLEPGKEYLIETRLAPVAKKAGLGGIDELVARLQTHTASPLHHEVVEAMTTNETSFFRDVHPFDALRDVVLPEVVANRQAQRRLRIWCAASSSGQEPYTIGMVLLEHFGHLADWDISIVATDISREMLDRAKAGRYSGLEVNRGLPARFLVKYFRKEGVEYQIDERLQRLVDYRELNLAKPFPVMGPFDVVFMRNVLIYFDQDTKRQILGATRRVMAPDGYLFLGGAETTINIDEGWLRIPQGQTSCYRLKP